MDQLPVSDQPVLLFDAIQVGACFGEYDWSASPELASAWRACMDEPVPDQDPDAFPLGLLGVMFSNYMDAKVPPRPSGMVYAKQTFRFGIAPRIGDVLTTRLSVQAKYLKRERRVVELAISTVNQRGGSVLEGIRTVIWGA